VILRGLLYVFLYESTYMKVCAKNTKAYELTFLNDSAIDTKRVWEVEMELRNVQRVFQTGPIQVPIGKPKRLPLSSTQIFARFLGYGEDLRKRTRQIRTGFLSLFTLWVLADDRSMCAPCSKVWAHYPEDWALVILTGDGWVYSE
jgi:hypothetical protein